MSLLREIKPKNARTARIVKARTESKLIEDRKRVLLLHGTKCTLPLHTVLKTVSALTNPHCVRLHKKNEIHPFDNAESLEFLAGKNDCGLVLFAHSTKKRPNSVTMARLFDGKILDMCELLLLPSADGQDISQAKLPIGTEMKPMILFAGNVWDDDSSTEQSTKFRMTRSLLLDVFQGEEIKTIDVEGLQYLLMVAASEPQGGQPPVVHLRWYKVRTKKSGQKLPRVEIDEVGPKLDFSIGRIQEPDTTIWKEAMKRGRRPDEPKKRKNIDMDIMGDKVGRVHLGKQDLTGLQTRKMKGLKRGNDMAEGDEDEEMGEDIMEDGISGDDIESGGSVDFDGVDFGDGDSDVDDMEVDGDQAETKNKRRRTR